MHIDFIISAFVLGIVVAIPPGSVTIIACQRALQIGFRNSLYFTFGSCLSDIFYLTLVYIIKRRSAKNLYNSAGRRFITNKKRFFNPLDIPMASCTS